MPITESLHVSVKQDTVSELTILTQYKFQNNPIPDLVGQKLKGVNSTFTLLWQSKLKSPRALPPSKGLFCTEFERTETLPWLNHSAHAKALPGN